MMSLQEVVALVIAIGVVLVVTFCLASISSDVAAFVQCYVRGTCF